jgi:hypothetical protein
LSTASVFGSDFHIREQASGDETSTLVVDLPRTSGIPTAINVYENLGLAGCPTLAVLKLGSTSSITPVCFKGQ